MRTFVLTDAENVAGIAGILSANAGEVVLLISGRPKPANLRRLSRLVRLPVFPFARFSEFAPGPADRMVVHLSKGVEQAVKKVSAVAPGIKALVVQPPGVPAIPARHRQPVVIDVRKILGDAMDGGWKTVEGGERVAGLARAIDPAKPLWILTQNDPDPDAIASAMALCHVLRRSRRNTPIVTLKAPTRSENESMISLLGIKIKTVTPSALVRAPQLAMVDVQPSYFGGEFPSLRVVIDHHPPAGECDAPYADVRPGYGATSTILSEYIAAAGLNLNVRLATALYYGIKTDTLLLGRGVSSDDFKAFMALWPLANHEMVDQMQRPRLKAQEVDVFIRALRGHVIEQGAIFAPLGKVHKEDLVPRLADFVRQIGEPGFALVWGEVGNVTTFSARAFAPKLHAGDAMKRAFGHLGSAGGHASMARATMVTRALRADFGGKSGPALDRLIRKRALAVLAKQKGEEKDRRL